MIIRETKDAFIMIRQHDHAFLSGEIVQHFAKGLIGSADFFEDAIYAAFQHDRGWIGLDDTPIWNDRTMAPYSFSDFPLRPKLAFYTIGLNEIEERNRYAALLCSMHFCSFFTHSKDEHCIQFVQEEAKRQATIKKGISDLNEPLLNEHFRLLQFADDLSLYLCLNEPGTTKEKEHPWFKEGFKNTEIFHSGNSRLEALWISESKIRVEPFPFTKKVEVLLQYKRLFKEDIQSMGISEAYKKGRIEQRKILIVPA
jgi:hypothetical protein